MPPGGGARGASAPSAVHRAPRRLTLDGVVWRCNGARTRAAARGDAALRGEDDVIETFPAQRAHAALRNRIRLRRAHRREDRPDPKSSSLRNEGAAIARIAISNQEAGVGVPGRGFNDLLSHPRRSGMGSHVPMHDLAAIMRDDEEDIQGSEWQRLHGKEIGGPDVRCLEAEEGPPARGWRGGRAVPVDRRAAHVDAQGVKLVHDALRPPAGIIRGQASDQRAGFGASMRDRPRRGPRLFERQ